MMETKIIQIDRNAPEPGALDEAGSIIKAGGLVAFPTETVYGLGGSALDPDAAAKIYAAKGRPSDNPLIVHISDTAQLDSFAEDIPDYGRKLAELFWPGPMTLVLKKKDIVPDTVTGGLDTVAVRLPSCAAARALIDAAGLPIAAPSANLSGRPSPTTAGHVKEDLAGRIDMIIDGGPCEIGLESTIIDCTGITPVILRPGYITAGQVEEVCGSVSADRIVEAKTREEAEQADSGGGPKAPGMKYRHYSPKAELTLFEGPAQEVSRRIIARARADIRAGRRVGILVSEETKGAYQVALGGIPTDDQTDEGLGEAFITSLGSSSAMEQVAAGLFAALRSMDEQNADVIYAESFPDEGVGAAVMNRLRKAAGFEIVSVRPGNPAAAEGEAPRSVFSRVIFAGLGNTTRSVICESIFGFLARDKGLECISRGVTVLFPEPLNEKAVAVLARHGLRPSKSETQLLESSDLVDSALILAMADTVKNRILKKHPEANFVYTLPEFVGEDTETAEPKGGTEEYEACYQDLLRLVTKAVDRIFAPRAAEDGAGEGGSGDE